MKKHTPNQFSTLSEHLGKKSQRSVGITLTIAQKSSKIIKKITKVWPYIYQSQPFSGAEANVSQPVHYNNGTLVIECDSSTVVNHLRFHQSHLIKQLHKYGFNNINLLHLKSKHKLNQLSSPEDLIKKTQTTTKQLKEKISKNSVKTIEACAKTTSSPLLKKSLDNLVKSLKNL